MIDRVDWRKLGIVCAFASMPMSVVGALVFTGHAPIEMLSLALAPVTGIIGWLCPPPKKDAP